MKKSDYIIGAVIIIIVVILLWIFINNCLFGELGEIPAWCLWIYG